jgi:hypothetical protein
MVCLLCSLLTRLLPVRVGREKIGEERGAKRRGEERERPEDEEKDESGDCGGGGNRVAEAPATKVGMGAGARGKWAIGGAEGGARPLGGEDGAVREGARVDGNPAFGHESMNRHGGGRH